jgi:hypothetical protein
MRADAWPGDVRMTTWFRRRCDGSAIGQDYVVGWVSRKPRHGRSITFQMAEVVVPRALFQQILEAIATLRPPAPARC